MKNVGPKEPFAQCFSPEGYSLSTQLRTARLGSGQPVEIRMVNSKGAELLVNEQCQRLTLATKRVVVIGQADESAG